jgi:hypothetical protein
MERYGQIKSRDRETITLKEVLQVLIPVAAVVFLFGAIYLNQAILAPRFKREFSYRKLIKKTTEKTIKEGDVLTLGKYDWNNTWRVLKVEDDRVLVINEDCIDLMNMEGSVSNYDPHLGKCFQVYPYIPEDAEIHHGERWKYTGLKKWLNDVYYDVTFNDKEKELFIETEYGRIFLLSREEAREYFMSDSDRRAKYIKYDYPWWLRSSSSYESYVYNDYVTSQGRIDGNSICYNNSNIGVRPAMWLKSGE